jgi:hypothetical protein
MSLLHVGLEANTGKEVDEDVQRPLKEFQVPQGQIGQIHVINVKECKKAAISSVIIASSSSLSSRNCHTHSLTTASTRMLKGEIGETYSLLTFGFQNTTCRNFYFYIYSLFCDQSLCHT